MNLHATRSLRVVNKREARAALVHLEKAAASLRMLSDSDLRYFLGEEPTRAGIQLREVAKGMQTVANLLRQTMAKTTGRESLGRNELLGPLVRFVRWSTGLLHDEELDIILTAILHSDSWSTARWRRDHKGAWFKKSPEWEGRWDTLVEMGTLEPPPPHRGRSRLLVVRRPGV
jgi:hypothetical protein